MTEAKLARFKRVFPPRVQKVRDSLRILSNCSTKNNYAWDQSQVRQVFGLLLREYISTAKQFKISVTAQVDGTDVRTLDQ